MGLDAPPLVAGLCLQEKYDNSNWGWLMTIMAHPSKKNVQRYRVFDKALGVQEYFSISALGKNKALKAAKERQAELDERRELRSMMDNMASSKLFMPDGSIKGLRRKYRQRKGRASYECLAIQVTVAENCNKGTEISMMRRSFEEAYVLAQQKLCEFHKVEADREIKKMFTDAKPRYWQSVAP